MEPKDINVSYSFLKQVRKSPLRAILWKEQPKASTHDQFFALGIECAIQEPDRFEAEYQLYSPQKADPERRGTKEWVEAESFVGRGKLLKPSQYEVIRRIQENFLKDEILGFIYSKGKAQHVLEWEKEGLNCKGVPDWISEAFPVIVDIKAVNCAADEIVSSLIFDKKNWWHMQAAIYRAGAAAHNIEIKHSLLIFCETEYPYMINAINLTDEQIHMGYVEFNKLFYIWKGCLQKNKFPGYSKGFHQAETPGYYSHQFYRNNFDD